MPLESILTSLHGRRVGLTRSGTLVLQKGGALGDPARQDQLGLDVQVTLTAVQMQNLFTTPVVVIPAPGVGFALIVDRVVVCKPAGVAFAGVALAEDLSLKYTNAAGQQVVSTIETTGFLDSATNQVRTAGPIGATGATAGDVTPADNASIVAALLVGDVTGGSPVSFRVWYKTIPTTF